MDPDERDICSYLKSWPNQFVSGRDIARRAGGKWRFREDQDWAVTVLARLVEKGVVESDSTGHYRLRRAETKPKSRKWISPQIRKLLEKNSKDFSQILEIDDSEDT